MWLELLYHSAARLASAGFSFLLFALVARDCSAEDAKAVYFYAFALGFMIVTVRTYGVLAARLDGRWRSAQKLRAVLGVTGELLLVQVAALLLAGALFSTHSISPVFMIVTPFVVALSGLDADLLRAALNKRSIFSPVFAAGGMLGLIVFALAPEKTRAVGCGALLVQWAPVVGINAYIYARLFWRRARLRGALARVRVPAIMGSSLVVVFDGAVINAPFLLGQRVGTLAGLDLSVATRIFVSSLPLVPLLMHWSNSGSLARMATRLGVREPRLYSALIAASGVFGGVLLAAIYTLISGKSVTWTQYGCSVGLLLAYSSYAGRARFAAVCNSNRTTLLVLSGILLVFIGVYWGVATFMDVGATAYAAWEALTLVAGGAVLSATSTVGRARQATSLA